MNIRDLINQFGSVTYSVGINPIHEDDIGTPTDYNTKQVLYRCINVTPDDQYLVLTAGNRPFRVLASHFIPMPTPPFWMEERLRVKAIPDKKGVVYRIGWHSKRKEPLFYLRIGNRQSSHRYFAEELERVSE